MRCVRPVCDFSELRPWPADTEEHTVSPWPFPSKLKLGADITPHFPQHRQRQLLRALGHPAQRPRNIPLATPGGPAETRAHAVAPCSERGGGRNPRPVCTALSGGRRRTCTRVRRAQPMPDAERCAEHRRVPPRSHLSCPALKVKFTGLKTNPKEKHSYLCCALGLAICAGPGRCGCAAQCAACVSPALFAPSLRHPWLTFHIK